MQGCEFSTTSFLEMLQISGKKKEKEKKERGR